MPELPEVETIRLTLQSKILAKKILDGEVYFPKLIQNLSIQEFLTAIRGERFTACNRRGKYLLLHLSNGFIMTVHLRMTGQIIVVSADEPITKVTHMRLILEDGNELHYRDQRKFGRINLVQINDLPTSIEKLGPEPLSPEFSIQKLKEQLSHRKIAIKKILLDQETIAGIGNIYADEALFLAEIHPARLVASLTDPEVEALYHAIRRVLSEGIKFRGTTKRDYRDAEGKSGSYQEQLKVYGRKGAPCCRCQNMIVKMNFGGRGTHFCPICQK